MAPSFTPEWKFCTSQEALLLLIWKHLSNCIQTHICHFFRNHWQTICLERNKCWNNFKRKISQASHSLLIKKQKLILYNIYLSSFSKMFPTGRNKISKKKRFKAAVFTQQHNQSRITLAICILLLTLSFEAGCKQQRLSGTCAWRAERPSQ